MLRLIGPWSVSMGMITRTSTPRRRATVAAKVTGRVVEVLFDEPSAAEDAAGDDAMADEGLAGLRLWRHEQLEGGTLDFEMDRGTKIALMKEGYDSTLRYFEKEKWNGRG